MAASVPHLPTPSNTFYAAYLDLDGIAQRVSGGWLFREDGTGTVIPVDLHNPDLMLFGNCALADAQRAADGDLVVQTSRTVGRQSWRPPSPPPHAVRTCRRCPSRILRSLPRMPRNPWKYQPLLYSMGEKRMTWAERCVKFSIH